MVHRRVAIVGIGQTPFTRKSGRSAWELALDAALDALADAGLEATEVDGLVRYALPTEYVSIPMMQRSLGIRELRYYAEAPLGGEAMAAVVNHAVAAIASAQASVVLLWRALNQSSGVRFGRADQRLPIRPDEDDVVVPEDGENRSFTWPYGQMSPAHIFGLWARRYMYDNRLTDADMTRALGTIAIQQRANANNNPGAVFYERPLTWDEYEHARWISKPIRLFDMCLENDSACALVLVDAERARSLRADPAYVLSVTQSLSAYKEPMGLYGADLMQWFPPAAVERLYSEARARPSDISVAGLYDATSFMPLKSLETYGLAPIGKAWKHVIEHGTGLDSPVPVNTHGGFLSEGYIHGMSTITEAVRQLRGTAHNQVRRMLALYCQLMDDRRYGQWSQLFAADGVWAFGGSEYHGPAEARAFMDRLLRDRPERRTKHLCTNSVIDLDGDRGYVTSDYAMLAREGDGPWGVVSLGRYQDQVVRRADGHGWQFAERRLSVA